MTYVFYTILGVFSQLSSVNNKAAFSSLSFYSSLEVNDSYFHNINISENEPLIYNNGNQIE